LDIKKFDLLALYSPSDVKAILERFPAEELPAVATFGEGTLRAAVDAGIKVKAMAPTPTVPSMAKAVDIYLTKLAKGEQIEDVAVTHDADKEEFIRTQQHKLAKKSRTRRTTPAEKK
jgi:Uroporphyrinogen-III synthase HemD.